MDDAERLASVFAWMERLPPSHRCFAWSDAAGGIVPFERALFAILDVGGLSECDTLKLYRLAELMLVYYGDVFWATLRKIEPSMHAICASVDAQTRLLSLLSKFYKETHDVLDDCATTNSVDANKVFSADFPLFYDCGARVRDKLQSTTDKTLSSVTRARGRLQVLKRQQQNVSTFLKQLVLQRAIPLASVLASVLELQTVLAMLLPPSLIEHIGYYRFATICTVVFRKSHRQSNDD